MEMWVAVHKAVAVEHPSPIAMRALAKPVARRARIKAVASKATLATMWDVSGRVHRLRLPFCQLRL
jgi:hypothetical protein